MTPQASANPANQPTYVEEPTVYLFTTTLTADDHVPNASVNIDRDSDFLLTGIFGSPSAAAFTMNFRLPSGRLYASAELLNTDFLGTANQPTAIGPAPIYRAGSVGPQLELTDVSGNTNDVVIYFVGVRRLRTT